MQVAAITEMNKVEKVYDAGADNRQLVVILRQAPDPRTGEMPAIDAQSVARDVANSTPPELNP